jgi:hypothetical protein
MYACLPGFPAGLITFTLAQSQKKYQRDIVAVINTIVERGA